MKNKNSSAILLETTSLYAGMERFCVLGLRLVMAATSIERLVKKNQNMTDLSLSTEVSCHNLEHFFKC